MLADRELAVIANGNNALRMYFFMLGLSIYKESAIFLEKGYCQFDTFLIIFTAEILN
jgi:hypothetical protein